MSQSSETPSKNGLAERSWVMPYLGKAWVCLSLMMILASAAGVLRAERIQGSKGLTSVGSWNLKETKGIVQFYSIQGEFEENALREEVSAMAKKLLKSYDEAGVVVLYNEKTAKEFASFSPEKIKQLKDDRVNAESRMLFGGEGVWGGMRAAFSKKNPEGEFLFEKKHECQKQKELGSDTICKTNVWDTGEGYGWVVEFYYAPEEIAENALKSRMMDRSKTLLQKRKKADLMVMFDELFIRELSSDISGARAANSGSFMLGEMLFTQPEKIWGGAWLQVSKENPEGLWRFMKREPRGLS